MISDITIAYISESINKHLRSKKSDAFIPTFDQLKHITHEAFFASLKKEEGSSISFKLLIEDERNLPPFSDKHSIFAFDSKLSLDINTLVKISPAHDKIRSLIVISVGSGYDIFISGLLVLKASVDIDVISLIENDSAIVEGNNDDFIISVPASGVLEFSIGSEVLGRFSDGNYILSSPSYYSSLSIGYYLKRAVSSHDLYCEYSDRYWSYYKAILKRLIYEARNRGHGATIVIICSDSLETSSQYIIPKYKFKNNINIEHFISSILAVDAEPRDIVINAHKIIDVILQLSQLSTVDGALVLNDKFEFITFGATLSAPQWDGEIVIGADGNGKVDIVSFDAKKLGTRHNSAIAFTGKCSGSFIFVISHDGPIRALTQTLEKPVVCWPNCIL